MAYLSAPQFVQSKVAALLLFIGAAASVALYLAIAYVILAKRQSTQHKIDTPTSKDQIYIGPDGTPIRLVNESLKVNLKLFASVNAQLVYIKLELGNSKVVKVTLADGEPHQLEAGKIFSKSIERSLTEDEVQTVRSELLRVQGTAKFAGNLEVPFHFQTNPLLI